MLRYSKACATQIQQLRRSNKKPTKKSSLQNFTAAYMLRKRIHILNTSLTTDVKYNLNRKADLL